uniref:Putative AP2-like ethylene-responsive transcription factor n=1 Tax=Helianthus annuus TaxID=4232 RepID=A0A251VII9_HELAN
MSGMILFLGCVVVGLKIVLIFRHRQTGRYEAHLWDKEASNATKKKGKQGTYDEEESAAKAYDLAALKFFGTSTQTNFPVTEYEKDLEMMEKKTKEDYLDILKRLLFILRKSDRFSRGASKYRGVARHHGNTWEARIGNVGGKKSLYIGTYSTEEEAAHAYDVVAIKNKGTNAATNFDKSTYTRSMTPGSNSACDVPSHAEDQPLPPTTTTSRHHIN